MDVVEIKLSESDINIINDIFRHAINGMGLGKYSLDEHGDKIQLPSNSYQEILGKFLSFQDKGVITAPRDIAKAFLEAYIEACNTIDSTEMETITGYKWEQTQEVVAKLNEYIK